ncbi:aspartyl-tRNA synthetase,Aspartate--tRNA ligase,aspartyl-tRNA synthetase,Aspartyl/asparaginyl-tRNA synthetases,aspartate--tRNA ligase,tRNA synthetases class II (D, K and N) [Chlamydia suis]|uniref:aspartate--tRNA ligase n=1 Tax=Chlamydia suis TaxID=83559 RepID=UPI0009AF5F6C|nr:aspartate--tRNA ligase [Chlamydia suis]SIU03576.1 aspartyl-tRNA synthetase,Aspartate--tRNA ligase,aspartyl-tRNA synthetase,Aspartyl/asparaginyl-tRNA synthetases,aspartate--tRNA ligase,tRNA synthetases class II (D, K and N) [Chlamydia suis]
MKYRTHKCNELSLNHVGDRVRLSGWVHRYRNHGGVVFIDLRDRFGITQIVCRQEESPELHRLMDQVRSEWVLCVEGLVCARLEGMENPNLATGSIEVEVSHLEILSRAQNLPFSISDEHINVNEELRLTYRYLDMRRGDILDRLMWRHKVMLACREYLDEQGFTEVVTPILGKSTPEGARDYLVPSRIYPGNFYALPQSPQLFKQILMVGGLDRYFQIATCFRDEDLRADRQPEFAQIDMEMSFGGPEDLFPIVENLVARMFAVKGVELSTPFQRMTYQEAKEFYGTDKPDLRFGLRLKNCCEYAKKFSFSIFLDQMAQGGIVKGFCVPGGADISRKQLDGYTDFVKRYGAMGLVWIKNQDGKIASNVAKFASEEVFQEMFEAFEAKDQDMLLLVAAPEAVANQSLDHLRRLIAKERQLYDATQYQFVWITDFPLFAKEDGELCPEHHPFTAPLDEDIPLLDKDPLSVRSSSYDLVLNGYEIASGSQRIHNPDLQNKIFGLLKLSQESVKEKFGFFIDALSFGTPPHLGIALGLDRIMMVLTGAETIREVIAFPKTQKAGDLMMSAPSEILPIQLKELGLKL